MRKECEIATVKQARARQELLRRRGLCAKCAKPRDGESPWYCLVCLASKRSNKPREASHYAKKQAARRHRREQLQSNDCRDTAVVRLLADGRELCGGGYRILRK